MKRIKTGNVVACEYVALGSYSKHTLINVYTGDIAVREFPATFPLAFFIEIIPHEGMPQEIKIQIKQGRKTSAELVVNFKFELGKPALMILPQILLTFPNDTVVQVVGSGDGLKPTVLATKKVRVGPFPAG